MSYHRILIFTLCSLFLSNLCFGQERFNRLNGVEDAYSIQSYNLHEVYALSSTNSIAIGSTIDLDGVGFFLCLINKESGNIHIASDEYDAHDLLYGAELYAYEFDQGKIILWEMKNEYYSMLLLFSYKNAELSYLGKFCSFRSKTGLIMRRFLS